ncbi:DNA-directed RNA polymerase specialized sigma subunit, sigma24 homolog [Microbacterium testaceum StLB037]|uniref:RNA polymerase sigma factor n=1 Tax=Microbacterium testaceum (strain StLB037) TaxID=979556 RepID=E8NCV8_MICTS|nr:sigma-70 family RNA polymerase sigma factor [Microbacterium testaceum]BAJ76188.1 DNA-directed RNA polymerase specialized sigma subunit, sigma24 homolog [Microbacterium testaceum StLB037]
MSHDVIDDRALVARAAGGSEVAYRELYRAYVRPVYWIAFGLMGDATDAEDVVQDTFVVAWRKIPSLRLEGTSLLPWLATVCRLQAQNRLRARRRHGSHAGLDEDIASTVDVEAQVVQAETVAAILAVVDRLGDLDREIFRLCAAEGYGYQAAAEHLGVSHGTVRNRLSRIRTRVRATAMETETP